MVGGALHTSGLFGCGALAHVGVMDLQWFPRMYHRLRACQCCRLWDEEAESVELQSNFFFLSRENVL
ncbi:Prolyl oligopeptidase family protein [Prunus dulcis]|uniref:Prolyl oligopeptidase family protein n=1 Tax=Prunus dulcis TaxID=3755 RepID=A0A4Y1RQZ0_PRUDU|nr:Prolyl oligopeptidase family protein [Prunus dulcis]